MKDEDFKEFVIDASFVLAHLLPDERIKIVDNFFVEYKNGTVELFGPYILPFEVASGIRSAYLQKRIKLPLAQELIDTFLSIKITLMPIYFQEVLSYAIKKNISTYDASFICLSKQSHMPLLTLDKKLQTFIDPKFKLLTREFSDEEIDEWQKEDAH